MSAKGLYEPRFGWMWVIKPLDQGRMLCVDDKTEVVGVATGDVYQPDDWLKPINFEKAGATCQVTSLVRNVEVMP